MSWPHKVRFGSDSGSEEVGISRAMVAGKDVERERRSEGYWEVRMIEGFMAHEDEFAPDVNSDLEPVDLLNDGG